MTGTRGTTNATLDVPTVGSALLETPAAALEDSRVPPVNPRHVRTLGKYLNLYIEI